MIEIDYRTAAKAREYAYSVPNMQYATDKLNKLISFIEKNHGYQKGQRNNIAVNLCCLCWVLNLDPDELAREFINAKNDYLIADYNDIAKRIIIITDYLPDWHKYHTSPDNGVLDYMLIDGSEIVSSCDEYVMLLV